MTGKEVNLHIGHTSIRCSLCGDVLAVLNDDLKYNSVVVDFLGHLRKNHPECLYPKEEASAIQSAIKNQSAILDSKKKADYYRDKTIINPYLPPQ